MKRNAVLQYENLPPFPDRKLNHTPASEWWRWLIQHENFRKMQLCTSGDGIAGHVNYVSISVPDNFSLFIMAPATVGELHSKFIDAYNWATKTNNKQKTFLGWTIHKD